MEGIAKQKALQGIEINLGVLREGKEASIAGKKRAERNVRKNSEVVMGMLLRLSAIQFLPL